MAFISAPLSQVHSPGGLGTLSMAKSYFPERLSALPLTWGYSIRVPADYLDGVS